MTNGEELKKAIRESGVKITFLAEKLQCSRNRVYSIIDGADCTASEIVTLSQVLRLTKARRDNIFLLGNVNNIH